MTRITSETTLNDYLEEVWDWVTSRGFRSWTFGILAVVAMSVLVIAAIEESDRHALWTGRVGILGTIATIVGLVVALRQLARTATAAEASQTASREAERRTTASIAVSLVDHLLIVDNEMVTALLGSRDEVLRVIRHWRQTAGEVQRLVATLDPLERDFARRLQESIALGTACAHALDASLPLPRQVAEFRRAVGDLCNDVPELKAHLATRSGGALA